MGKSAPAAPDPVTTANAQGAANVATAQATAELNRPDTYGPGGSVVNGFGVDGDANHAQQVTTLSPAQQQIYDTQQNVTQVSSQSALNAANQMSGLLATPIDTSSLTAMGGPVDPSLAPALQSSIPGAGQGIATSIPGAGQGIDTGFSTGQPLSTVSGAGQGVSTTFDPGSTLGKVDPNAATAGLQTNFDGGSSLARIGPDDFSADRDAVTNSILARTAPQDDRDRAAMEARLAAQGFTTGSAGYNSAADELDRRATDERMQAVLAGGQEQSRLFGLDEAKTGFNNAAQQAEVTARNNAMTLDNAAQAQGFGQTVSATGFDNAAQEAEVAARNAATVDANTAQGQIFGQGVTQAGFNNDASQAQTAAYNTGLQDQNTAQQQGFTQAAQNAAFGNAAQGQSFDQASQNAAFQNTARGQALNEAYTASDFATKTRQQQLAEKLELRAQPVNEVSALFGLGNQVQMPQQANVAPSQVASPDYQGLVSNNYKAQSQAAAQANSTDASAVTALAMAAAMAA